MGVGNTTNPANGNSGGNGGNQSNAGKTGAPNKSGESGPATGTAATEPGTGTGTPTASRTGTETKAGPGTEKTGSRNNATVNPTSLAPDDIERDAAGNPVLKEDGTPRKKRGRKPGQQYGASPNTATNTVKPKVAKTGDRNGMAVEMLAAQFAILNTGLAYLTRFEDWKLEDEEAMQMANAAANVMAQFDYMPDPKVTAVLGLVTTTSMIYGPRMYLYRKALAERREANQTARNMAADERAANGAGYPGGPMNYGQFSG